VVKPPTPTPTWHAPSAKQPQRKRTIDEILQQPSVKLVQISSLGGGMKIEYKGHHFKFHYTKNNVKYLRCVKFAETKCEASVVVAKNQVYENVAEHNHADVATVADEISKYMI
jgi:FLYWCH zinc finger domain